MFSKFEFEYMSKTHIKNTAHKFIIYIICNKCLFASEQNYECKNDVHISDYGKRQRTWDIMSHELNIARAYHARPIRHKIHIILKIQMCICDVCNVLQMVYGALCACERYEILGCVCVYCFIKFTQKQAATNNSQTYIVTNIPSIHPEI